MQIKKFVIPITVAVLVLFCVPVFAQNATTAAPSESTSTAVTQEVQEDENVTPQELGVPKPTILPDNPLYIFKDWWRGIHSFFTFNPIAKARLEARYASEKLIEAKDLAEKTKNPRILDRATHNYEKQMDRVKKIVDKIKGSADKNPKVAQFLDKFIHQQILHEKILDKLEGEVPTSTFQRIKAARERHLKRFAEVMQKLESKDKIGKRLSDILQKMKGSKFKDIKALQILKSLEKRLPESARTGIGKAEENILRRLKKKLENASTSTQERFKGYLQRIQMPPERKLEILQHIRQLLPNKVNFEKRLEGIKGKILRHLQENQKKIGCPEVKVEPNFCPHGWVVPKRDSKGCVISFRCIQLGERRLLHKMRQFKQLSPTSTIKRMVCPALFEPVCGSDGKTYSNTCWLKVAGVKIAHKGPCQEGQRPIEKPPIVPPANATTSGVMNEIPPKTLPQKVEGKTCSEICQSQGFSKGVCRSWAITPAVHMGCLPGEKNIGQTSDCFVPRRLLGRGETCCCQK